MEYRKRSRSNPLNDPDVELGITEYDKFFDIPIKKQNIVKHLFSWIYVKLTGGYMRRYVRTNNLPK